MAENSKKIQNRLRFRSTRLIKIFAFAITGIISFVALIYPFSIRPYSFLIEIGDVEDFVDVNSFTIEAWIRKDSDSTGLQQVVSRKRGEGIDAGYYIAVTADNKVQASVADGINLTSKNSTSTISLGVWHHIVMVLDRDEETLQVYIDGQAQGSPANITPNIDPSNNASLTKA